MFSGNVVYRKVVDNSVIYLLLKFGSIWRCGLWVMSVPILIPEMAALCLSGTDSGSLKFRPA